MLFIDSTSGQVVFACRSVALTLWIPISCVLADADGEAVTEGVEVMELPGDTVWLGVGDLLGVDDAAGDTVTLELGL